jgi:hypothetical protein
MKKALLITLLTFMLGVVLAEVVNAPNPQTEEQTKVLIAAKSVVVTLKQALPMYTCSIIGWRYLDNGNTLEIFHQYQIRPGGGATNEVLGWENPGSVCFYKVQTETGAQWIYKDSKWKILNTTGQLPTGH